MLRGHRTHSFYVKARFTADGEYAICGSSDSNAYLWNLQGGMNSYRLPVKVLEGHLSEINGVDSCQTEFGKYATCSDDGAIKVWRIQR